MKIKISFFFLVLSAFATAQKTTNNENIKLGTEISTTFSGFEQNGLTPFLLLKKNKVSFAIGPRFVYSSFNDYEIRNKNNQVVTVDANFRIYASNKPSKYRPYIQFSAEYQYGHNYSETAIDPLSPPTIGGNTLNIVNLGTDITRHNLNMYTNLGFEVRLTDHIYFNNLVGLGLQTAQKTTRYGDLDKGELVFRDAEELHSIKKLGWNVNLGLGFRF